MALLDASNRVSARSAEVSAVPGNGAGSAVGPTAGPPASAGAPAGPGVNATAPASAPPLPGRDLPQDPASSSLPVGLVVLLVALVLAAAAGAAAAAMLRRRRRYDRRYGPVPAPRRPHDDQPAGQFSPTEQMNGPRYR